MNQTNLPLTEDVFDFFKKNLDPDVLRDRMNQAARTRDAAREAAQIAEKKGNQALADQLNQDADNLQRLIDETIAQANSVRRSTPGGSSTGGRDTKPSKTDDDPETVEPTESPEEAEDTEETTPSGKQNQEENEDDDDSESDSESGSDNEAGEEEDSDNSSKNNSNSSQTNKQNSSRDANQNASAGNDAPESDETDGAGADLDSEDEAPDSADNSGNDENDDGTDDGDDFADNNSGETEDDEYDDGYDDEDDNGDSGDDFADNDSDGENDFGPPKIEDKKILQNPFKSDQIPTQLPKDMQQQIADGELEIESEEDAIVRIISKLSGEARRGAEKALRDVYEQIKPSWWGAIDEG